MNKLLYKLQLYGFRRLIQFLLGEIHMRIKHVLFGSYSQYNEDIIIDNILINKKMGFYVDIGAYDPFRFSNTAHFYKKGWNGINIEPNYLRLNKFDVTRKRDINLNVGVGKKRKKLPYYEIDPQTLSTFSKKQAFEYKTQGFHIEHISKISVIPLADILRMYLKKREIDFMSIDVEGYELNVLQSNDWKLYRPKILCIELSLIIDENRTILKREEKIIHYIASKGYQLVAKTSGNYIYLDRENIL